MRHRDGGQTDSGSGAGPGVRVARVVHSTHRQAVIPALPGSGAAYLLPPDNTRGHCAASVQPSRTVPGDVPGLGAQRRPRGSEQPGFGGHEFAGGQDESLMQGGELIQLIAALVLLVFRLIPLLGGRALRLLVNDESQSEDLRAGVDFAETGRTPGAAGRGRRDSQEFRAALLHGAGRRSAARATSCGQALGEAGFIGVNIPEAYGGGGGGLTELALVCEEIAAAGHAAAAAARLGGHLGRDDHRVRHRGAAPDGGCPAWPAAPPRWCSRSPSRTPARTRCGCPPPPSGTARTGC